MKHYFLKSLVLVLLLFSQTTFSVTYPREALLGFVHDDKEVTLAAPCAALNETECLANKSCQPIWGSSRCPHSIPFCPSAHFFQECRKLAD